jgi:hypothetical protein
MDSDNFDVSVGLPFRSSEGAGDRNSSEIDRRKIVGFKSIKFSRKSLDSS